MEEPMADAEGVSMPDEKDKANTPSKKKPKGRPAGQKTETEPETAVSADAEDSEEDSPAAETETADAGIEPSAVEEPKDAAATKPDGPAAAIPRSQKHPLRFDRGAGRRRR
jgi:hypothetical protein